MEKSATNVLLQLIDCIESLKNEVKRKMHGMKRAVLYQSHSRINSQEKNIVRSRHRGNFDTHNRKHQLAPRSRELSAAGRIAFFSGSEITGGTLHR